jgi:hypothetical protein
MNIVGRFLAYKAMTAVKNAGAELNGEWFQSAILPWARQVAETERKQIESRRC